MAGAFRGALEERLKRISLIDQIDPNRIRRQVSFDRLLARLFREESAPWALKGGYALELRFNSSSPKRFNPYTLPRNSVNSRVKDLADLALLIGSGELEKQRILDALRLTFERRATHALPAESDSAASGLADPVSSPGRRMWVLD